MDKFLMICYVCADFVSPNGDRFKVSPRDLGTFIEAPVWIQKTLLFGWLVNDGSIKIAEKQISKKQGENDPLEGMSAEGKNKEISEANEKMVTENEPSDKIIKTRKRTSKKAEAKDDAQ